MSCTFRRHEVLFSPHCRAVLTWLADVGLSFTKRFADPHKFHRFPASFMKMKVNPQHMMPTLQDNSLMLGKSRFLNKHYVTKIESDQIRKNLHLRDQDVQTTRLLSFNIGIFYQRIGYMHPRLVLDLPQVPEKRAVMERSLECSENFMKGAADGVRRRLLLVKGRLHEVRGQRAFAFDVRRTSTLTVVSSPHQNFGRIFCNLYHTDRRGHAKDTTWSKRFIKSKNKARYDRRHIQMQPNNDAMTLVYDARQKLGIALRRFYATDHKKKIENRSPRIFNKSMRKAETKFISSKAGHQQGFKNIYANYHNSTKGGDSSGKQNFDKRREQMRVKNTRSIICCAKAHKNVEYALNLLKDTFQDSESSCKTKTQLTNNDAKNIAKAMKLLEVADENLKQLLGKMMIQMTMRRNNNNNSQKGGKPKRKMGEGQGPRSLSLMGHNPGGGSRCLYHTESSDKEAESLKEKKEKRRLVEAPVVLADVNSHSEIAEVTSECGNIKAEEGVSIKETEILGLLIKVHNLGSFLQEIHETHSEKGQRKNVLLKETEILGLLSRAHQKLCHIINQMNHTFACGQGGFEIDPEHERFREGQRKKKLKQDRKDEELLKKRELKKILQSHRKAKREGKKLSRWKPDVPSENKDEEKPLQENDRLKEEGNAIKSEGRENRTDNPKEM